MDVQVARVRTTIDIAADHLVCVIPTLEAFVRVVGSATSEEPGIVTFIIEADDLPAAPKVTCEVTKVIANGVGQMTYRFKPVA